MIINHNLSALNANRMMNINSSNANKSMQKLSSGLRINSAADDAAGLAISEKMRGQIRGLDQASANASDGISLLQTAEGALNETHSILQRMRELSVQSSNDTNTLDDRKEIQKEIEQLKSETNRISDNTEFNTQKLLNGSLGAVGNSADASKVEVVSVTGLKVGTYTTNVDVVATKAAKTSGGNAVDADVATAVAAGALKINGVTIDTTGVTDVASLTTKVNSYKDQTGVEITAGTAGSAAFVLTATEYGSAAKIDLSGSNAAWNANGVFGAAAVGPGVDAKITITTPDSVSQQVTGNGQNVVYQGAEFNVLASATGAGPNINVTTSGATLQIGSNQDQNMLVDINEMSTKTLGDSTVGLVKDIDVQTQDGANKAIETLDKAIKQVSAERSKIGAFQNRLEHTINNLGTSSENMTTAEARIRDVDMAKEMSTFSKNNILSQAAQAMLAQANQQPQQVLQLLR
jgi:flagellin